MRAAPCVWALVLVGCSASTPELGVEPGAEQAPPRVAERSADPGPAPAPTALGPASLDEASRRLPLLAWEDYARVVEGRDRWPTFATRPELPEGALFGLNLQIGGENRSYAFVLGEDGGATLFPDLDGDGEPELESGWALTSAFEERRVGEGEHAYLAAFRWGRSERGPFVEARTLHRRRGVLAVSGREIAVELRGPNGRYGQLGSTLLVDLDGDGELDDDALADERFDLGVGGHVSIDALHLEFEVAARGDTITWTPRPDISSARPSVAMGATAPDFPVGEAGRLASLRGAPVVIEFFSPGCGFCAEAAPELREAAAGPLAEAGVGLISVEQSDSGEGAAFAEREGKTWPTLVGPDGVAVAELYRVRSVPTYVVVDAEGRMCARGSWLELGAAVRAGKPCDPPPS